MAILKSSGTYWATGIILDYGYIGGGDYGWRGRVEYYDDGFAGDNNTDSGAISTEGILKTRYGVRDGSHASGLRAVVDTLIADASRLGITFVGVPPIDDGLPSLYYQGDGVSAEDPPPDGWQELLCAEADRIGWRGPTASKVA